MNLVTRSQERLGSTISVTLPESCEQLFSLCFLELERIECTYSRFRDDSELSQLNARLGEWTKVSDEFFTLIQTGVTLGQKTQGNFDLTIKSALDALGYDKEYSFQERAEILRSAAQPVALNAATQSVLLQREIEIGGFGKGYCLDRLRAILDEHHVEKYCINAGGDIFAKGGWNIALEHPDDPSMAIGIVTLDGKAIACSAPNRRRWGKHHHLINAKTRKPQHEVKCIFVIAATGLEADGYATALFTAGFREAIILAEELPVEMLIVSSDDKVYTTAGFPAQMYT